MVVVTRENVIIPHSRGKQELLLLRFSKIGFSFWGFQEGSSISLQMKRAQSHATLLQLLHQFQESRGILFIHFPHRY